MSITGVIFNIQRFSIHDGPGIRTTVFLKGCPLHCFWCHNPEGIHLKPEVQYYPARCIGCGECTVACRHSAHEKLDGGISYFREKCIACGECIDTCYSNALELTGKYVTVEEVMKEVLQDKAFYENSKGGVTLSGGEPLLQREFSYSILEECKSVGLHTAIETSAVSPWHVLNELLPVVDLIMMDIKHMNPEKHKLVTGVSNERILENAVHFSHTDKPVIFRIPVVPTVNDTFEEINDITKFVQGLVDLRKKENPLDPKVDNIKLELLPFHRLAADKYRSLNLDYQASELEMIPKIRIEELKNIAKLEY